MGAVLLPVAVRIGLLALGVAMAMNLFGHGIALSGDYIIQAALIKEVGAVTLTVVGAITGLDGSGLSGISLAGSIASRHRPRRRHHRRHVFNLAPH